jgi:hypothetical protein
MRLPAKKDAIRDPNWCGKGACPFGALQFYPGGFLVGPLSSADVLVMTAAARFPVPIASSGCGNRVPRHACRAANKRSVHSSRIQVMQFGAATANDLLALAQTGSGRSLAQRPNTGLKRTSSLALVDEARASLRPLFYTVSGAGVYHVPAPEQELMHEIMFKLEMLRSAIIHCDERAGQLPSIPKLRSNVYLGRRRKR